MNDEKIQLVNDIPKMKFGGEDSFGAIGPTRNWWLGLIQVGFPEAPENRLASGLELAQTGTNPKSNLAPHQICSASLLMLTGLWGLVSYSLKYFEDEKTRMEMEISELRTRLTRLEVKRDERNVIEIEQRSTAAQNNSEEDSA